MRYLSTARKWCATEINGARYVLLCASNTVSGTPLLLYECGAACLKNENLHVGQRCYSEINLKKNVLMHV
jgi:hypothetical protein